MEKNNLLYAYKSQHDNRFTYAFTMELAKKLKLKVITFTAIDCIRSKEVSAENKMEFVSNEKRRIFTHLLALHGYYQVFYNQWSPEGNPVSKNIIENGSFNDCLVASIRNENIACVIIDPDLCQCIIGIEKKYKSEELMKDVPFMVLPKKISYSPNDKFREISTEKEKDTFLDSVIGDSDLFTLCSQKELTNS